MSDETKSTETSDDAPAASTPSTGAAGAETKVAKAEAATAEAAKAAVGPVDDPNAVEVPFQAEVKQVLALVINSLYTNHEIFLRELISNASDALDKARFLAMTRDEVELPEGEAAIQLTLDDDARTLTITDNGVGMTRDEAQNNLGTIAKSGSLEFIRQHQEALKKGDATAMQLIGQFGVGFYSAFMVASRIDVSTLSIEPGAEPVLWRSAGAGTFTLSAGDRKTPGTTITIHLKDEYRDFAKNWRVKEVIRKYSDFVSFPIYLGGELANRSKAIWAMPKSQVTEEQHDEFFRHLTGSLGDDKPLVTIHYAVDAPVQFSALLYVPNKAPFDLFRREKPSLRLYAKRVLIQEECEKLTPIYLRFLKGVVDSEDLTLNVSRETLQENKTLSTIEQQIVKQTLRALTDLAEEKPEDYRKFWDEFGKVLKEGITVDWKNKDAIAGLCRFASLNTDDGDLISLKQYVDAMGTEQKEIYYITGASRSAVEQSPHIEAFRKKGIDVLLLTDPIDEWVVQSLLEFDKKRLKSITHGDVDLGEEKDEDNKEESKSEPDAALSAVKDRLGERVKDVRFSKRLTDSPSCLVAADGDPGANFERIMKMMDSRTQEKKRILELNPDHAIIKNLDDLAKKQPDSPDLAEFAELLYDQALLAEGVVEDPARLVKRLSALMTRVTGSAAS